MVTQVHKTSNHASSDLHRLAAAVPPQLHDLPHWIVFRLTRKPDGRLAKTPLIPGTDRHASIADPTTWRPFAVAVADAERRGLCPGVAITPAMNLTIIDIDDHTDHDLVRGLDSYTERSISGRGLHILVRGRPPASATKPPGIEVYPGRRFLLLTGDVIGGRGTIEARSDRLAALFPPRPIAPLPPPRDDSGDDATIIERVLRMPRGRQLHAAGDASGYPSGSEADLALLCCYINAGATCPEQLDGLYRGSALYPERRHRWDDSRYRERTMSRALDGAVQPFAGWDAPKNGVVIRRPQDAVHQTEPRPAPSPDDLPDDISALTMKIHDLTRRVETAERRADAAERRAESAEARLANLALLTSRTAGIIKNQNLGQERFTAVALAHRFASLETAATPSADGMFPIALASVAEVAGVSPDAASRHIGRLVENGTLRKELRWVPPSVNPETGETHEGHKRQFLGLAGGSVVDFVAAVARLEPVSPKRWGGKRVPRCPDHPDAAITRRTTYHCATCDRTLAADADATFAPAAAETPPEIGLETGEPHLADHQIEPEPQPREPHPAGTDNPVVTVLRDRTVKSSDSHADFDPAGTPNTRDRAERIAAARADLLARQAATPPPPVSRADPPPPTPAAFWPDVDAPSGDRYTDPIHGRAG